MECSRSGRRVRSHDARRLRSPALAVADTARPGDYPQTSQMKRIEFLSLELGFDWDKVDVNGGAIALRDKSS